MVQGLSDRVQELGTIGFVDEDVSFHDRSSGFLQSRAEIADHPFRHQSYRGGGPIRLRVAVVQHLEECSQAVRGDLARIVMEAQTVKGSQVRRCEGIGAINPEALD